MLAGHGRVSGVRRVPGDLRRSPWLEPCRGRKVGKSGPKEVKNQECKNAVYVANEPSMVNSMNVGVENHAKGGYHAALSNARIS